MVPIQEIGRYPFRKFGNSYVSGKYVMEFGEVTADLMGRLNEFKNFNFGNKDVPSENMDLWNNAVGRYYGKKAKTIKELFDLLLKALKNGELIPNFWMFEKKLS